MNHIELNAVLYYADYLSLRKSSTSVTDNCKYFFIHGCPINSAYILNLEPIYDTENKFLLEAYRQYEAIKNRYGDDSVQSFIDDICFIRACGMVDAERMLGQIHLFSTPYERKQAFREYRQWKKNQKYFHTVFDEDGNPLEKECTKYFKHAEILSERQNVLKSNVDDTRSSKKQTN